MVIRTAPHTFVDFIAIDGKRVYVNPSHVVYVTRNLDAIELHLVNGNRLLLKGDIGVIVESLEGED